MTFAARTTFARRCAPRDDNVAGMRKTGRRWERPGTHTTFPGRALARSKPRRVGHPKNRCWQDALRDSLRQAQGRQDKPFETPSRLGTSQGKPARQKSPRARKAPGPPTKGVGAPWATKAGRPSRHLYSDAQTEWAHEKAKSRSLGRCSDLVMTTLRGEAVLRPEVGEGAENRKGEKQIPRSPRRPRDDNVAGERSARVPPGRRRYECLMSYIPAHTRQKKRDSSSPSDFPNAPFGAGDAGRKNARQYKATPAPQNDNSKRRG
jgi:hypothetical protein